MSKAPIVKCVAWIWGDWSSYRCDRPAKGEREGHPVCGIHLRSRAVDLR